MALERKEVREAVADEREALVEDLRRLSPDDWERPSLCDGWRVRDVVGHLVRLYPVYRYSAPFFVGLARYGFRVNTYIREDAIRHASDRSPNALLDALAGTRYEDTLTAKLHPWKAVPLSEVVVHGQDIRRPLGIERRFETERLVEVAELLKKRVGIIGRGGRPSNIRYDATDADWTWGNGEAMRAPLEHVVMHLAGRKV